MQRKECNGIEWLEFDLLSDITRLKHAIFLRHGGCSGGEYSSLNLAVHVGDNLKHVEMNNNKISEALKLPPFVWSNQCHGIAINEITSDNQRNYLQGDALTTKLPGIGLMIHHADCQAAIMYDPVHHAVANVHSGWRGSVQNIYAHSIRFMQQAYGSRPEDLLVCITPSLGPDNAQFIHYRKELPESFWEYQIKPDYFDFWAISKSQLMESGILPSHIEIASICTYGNPKDYFSFRRDRITGRHGTFVTLNL